jgi:hypothetical protein
MKGLRTLALPPAMRVALLLALGFGGCWTWLQSASPRGVAVSAVPSRSEAAQLEPVSALADESRDPHLASPRGTEGGTRAAAVVNDDPAARALAIRALGMAPSADAVPLLRQFMEAGEPQDRALAVAALRDVALREGDAGGRIRQLLRIQFHDGGDESVAQDARDALAELEDRLPAT